MKILFLQETIVLMCSLMLALILMVMIGEINIDLSLIWIAFVAPIIMFLLGASWQIIFHKFRSFISSLRNRL